MKKEFDFFQKTIFQWFQKYGRHTLPWRRKNITPYEIWVSEIMLQQTQVSRVLLYYEKFLKEFRNIETLANTSWKKFLSYYRGLGYYQRGKNMIDTAKIVAKKYHGVFPQNILELKKLPGIGEYTARAILSFGFGGSFLALDTNLQRVFGRFFHGSKYAILNVKSVEAQFSRINFRKFNAAIMDFANLVCTKKPKCESCPLKKQCKYFETDGITESRNLQKTRKKGKFSIKDARVFLWLHKDHREYYSANPDDFEVFKLPRGIISREQIKKYFLEKYHLEVAVRPPHKTVVLNNIPTFFVNAQILLGKHTFTVFKKEEIKKSVL